MYAVFLPLTFTSETDFDRVSEGDELKIAKLRDAVQRGDTSLRVTDVTADFDFEVELDVSERQRRILALGGLLDYTKANI